jgi:ATP-binding cassette subfamily F protein 3
MIAVDNLTKSFGNRVVFDHISFKINAKERVGLVGRNGHGKTTLLRILLGEEEYDSGSVAVPKGYRIGHVQQQLAFTQPTILKEGMRDLPESEKDHHWKVEKILAGLGFSPADMQRHPLEFSGGFQVRLNLAKALVSEPDLLLLDEPTNYLDITSIRWVERFLINWPHELVLITHDRGFVDRVVTHTLGIHRQKIRKIVGDTAKYYAQIAQDEEIFEKTRQNTERRAKEIELFISRFRAKARLAGMVQSRIKTLAKMEKKDKLEHLRTLEFSFRNRPFRGKHVLSVRDLAFAYPEQAPLLTDLNLSINTGDRVCVVGPNGKGKTTLLKLLAGQLTPQNGDIVFHPGVESGFYEQTNIQTLYDPNTVEQEIMRSHPDVERQLARNICGAMLFEGDEALKKIAVLSGGEKARVILGKLLVTPVNLLLLDEPSNHLDMESCDALIAALDNFEGTVIMVTHNEMFLHALAQRLIVFQNDQVYQFEGTYQDFLDKGGWGDEPLASAATEPQVATPAGPAEQRLTKKEHRRQRSAILGEHAKAAKPVEKAIAEAEALVEVEEKRLTQMNAEMVAAAQAQDGAAITRLSQEIHQCQSAIDGQFSVLEDLYRQKELLDAQLAEKMAQIGEE